jgi:hypothetical protein
VAVRGSRLTAGILTVGALLAAALAPAAAAASNADGTILSAYESTGSVPACRFSAAQLSHALRDIDTFDAVYFQDFPNAIKNALNARASGDCSVAVPTASNGPATRAPVPNIPVTASTDGSIPAPMLLLALFAILCALGAGGAWLLRRTDAPWAAAARHSLAEAGYRLGGAWAELTHRRSR